MIVADVGTGGGVPQALFPTESTPHTKKRVLKLEQWMGTPSLLDAAKGVYSY